VVKPGAGTPGTAGTSFGTPRKNAKNPCKHWFGTAVRLKQPGPGERKTRWWMIDHVADRRSIGEQVR